jgi:amidase
MSRLHGLTALQQAAAVRAREISPRELVEHYLGRIEEHSERLGAFVTVTPDAALAAAAEAERAVLAAGDGGTGLPPLHGVPIGIKDLANTAGVRTTFGSKVMADNVPVVDDHVVTKLRAAGTISLGKTNTPEFGAPCYTEPDVAPPARTPWDLTRSAGGSSGGAAAAVAAGLLPFAHGSDGGGSIRIPASVCGLVGIKVSRGRVSRGPLAGDLTGLAWDGPIARTVADAAALLDAMAGYMPGDPHWAPPLPAGETFLDHAHRGARGEPGRLRIGRYIDNLLDAPVHPVCRAAWEAASRLLADLGHEVVDIPRPPIGMPMRNFSVVWATSYASMPVEPAGEDLLRPLTRMLRERGRRVPATRYTEALAALQRDARAVIGATIDYDAVLTPTLAQPPARVGEIRDDADPGGDFRAQGRFTPYTALYNMTGQPAVSLPVHWDDAAGPAGAGSASLPIGVMLVGRPGDEAGLIRLSAQVEQAAGWQDRHPDLW